MSRTKLSQSIDILRYSPNGGRKKVTDVVSIEEPLEIRIRGQSIAISMRTPGHDRELAVGFAISEGLIERPEQLIEVAHCRRGEAEHPENIINLFLDANTACDLEKLSRHVYANSSCGICGKASLDAIRENWPSIQSDFSVRAQQLITYPDRLHHVQSEFRQTGGIHAAALFTQEGSLICVREDVGRHNAVDKVIGWSFLEGSFPLTDHLLLVSSRASFEIMQKALAARVPFVAAVSAPSSLAIQFAEENQQTLVGFLRETGFNIYSHQQRVQD
jgi:FdhD protein